MSDAPEGAPKIRRYQFFDERRPTRSWMPTLETINERFAQFCRAALLQYLQPPVEVAPQFAIEVIKHAEFVDRLAMPSHLSVIAPKPLLGTILLVFEAELAGMIVESRFGGSGRLPVVAVPDREFAPIELQTIRRIVDRLLDQLASAWKPVAAIAPEIVRHEVKPAFAAFANSTDLVIVSTFVVTLANSAGKLLVAIPQPVLQPLHERLVATTAERAVTRDPRWSEELRLGVASAMTELRVELATIELTVREFLNLAPGSVFEIARPDTVTVRAHGQPLFRGRWGRHGRRIAVRVEEHLPAAPDALIGADSKAKGDDSDAR